MNQHLRYYGRALYHAGIRSQISSQNSNTAGCGVRIFYCSDDLRVLIETVFDILPYGLSCNSHTVQIKQSQLADLIHHCINTACLIEILHIGRTCRSQMTEVWGFCTDFIGNIYVQLYACLVGNRRKMKHTVGAAAKSHIHRQSISKSRFCHNIPGADILLQHFHYCHAGMLCQNKTF